MTDNPSNIEVAVRESSDASSSLEEQFNLVLEAMSHLRESGENLIRIAEKL